MRVHPAALVELGEAVEFLASRRRELGARFYRQVAQRIEFIERFPTSGVSVPGTEPRHDIRRFILRRGPYEIVTAIVAGERMVIAIAHTRRRPLYWADRLR